MFQLRRGAKNPREAWAEAHAPKPAGSRLGRGRDNGYPLPPAQTRAGATNAHGSYLGCWDVWRRSARSDRVAEFGSVEAGCPGLPENLPAQAAALASAPKRSKPHPQHVVAERLQSRPVARNGVILEIPPHHLPKPLPRRRWRYVHPLSQLGSKFFELGRHALADRPAAHREVPGLVAGPTHVGETQKIEGLRLPFSSLLRSLSGIAPELHQARLLRVQFQPELRQPLPQLLQEPLRFCSLLEPQHGVVGVAHASLRACFLRHCSTQRSKT